MTLRGRTRWLREAECTDREAARGVAGWIYLFIVATIFHLFDIKPFSPYDHSASSTTQQICATLARYLAQTRTYYWKTNCAWLHVSPCVLTLMCSNFLIFFY